MLKVTQPGAVASHQGCLALLSLLAKPPGHPSQHTEGLGLSACPECPHPLEMPGDYPPVHPLPPAGLSPRWEVGPEGAVGGATEGHLGISDNFLAPYLEFARGPTRVAVTAPKGLGVTRRGVGGGKQLSRGGFNVDKMLTHTEFMGGMRG